MLGKRILKSLEFWLIDTSNNLEQLEGVDCLDEWPKADLNREDLILNSSRRSFNYVSPSLPPALSVVYFIDTYTYVRIYNLGKVLMISYLS